ncbi:MAG TPA: hypothetical protein VH350_05390 [Candidatus Sulfotelmatobacter sp.]|jgi:CheY-like chemotaxis protein|nr:hypothetical protein [Candidatus Sulfotelmatobacter sp.]
MAKRRADSILCIGNNPVYLNLRCLRLRQNGWTVLSSGNGHEGILRFAREVVDAVVVDLNHDGSEAALITGELKRLRNEVPIVLVISDEKPLAPGTTQQASAVILRSQEELKLVETLKTLLPSSRK